MALILVGLAVAFNILVIIAKFNRGRTEDAMIDISLLVLVAYFFSGSYNALVVGTVASATISIALLFMVKPKTKGTT